MLLKPEILTNKIFELLSLTEEVNSIFSISLSSKLFWLFFLFLKYPCKFDLKHVFLTLCLNKVSWERDWVSQLPVISHQLKSQATTVLKTDFLNSKVHLFIAQVEGSNIFLNMVSPTILM